MAWRSVEISLRDVIIGIITVVAILVSAYLSWRYAVGKPSKRKKLEYNRKCKRCGSEWYSAGSSTNRMEYCPRCGSYNWNKPAKEEER